MSDTETKTTEDDLGAAGSQLSTAPKEESPSSLPAMGVIGWIRWFWRQLTSMRVALLLLLLLSLGAIPGSLIPQTSINAAKVDTFKADHTFLTPIYEKLGMFHVYSSVWFSAIYILLFVSLIGCIVPRTWTFVGQLRSRPPGAPRNLKRLPAYTTWRTESSPEDVRAAALSLLKKRRFRAHVAGDAVASEKGFLRETGNLIFHIALIVMLVAFASGQLWKSEGGKLMVEDTGDGFSNTLSQYDDFTPGNLFDADDLKPFSFTLDQFVGTYERTGPNRGTPRKYEAHVTYSKGVDGKDQKGVIKVNEPLVIDGTKVYLISHGYAPVVSVKDGKGNEIYREAVPLLPLDSNVTSSGAIKVMDGYKNPQGKKEQLGFNAMFVPTFKGHGTMMSQYPGLDFPVLALSGYHGSLGVDSGLPQSVYQLDSSKMKKFTDSKGQLYKKLLLPGETMKLPNGAGSIQFVGVKQWASFQISQQPGNNFALIGAIAAILGLAGSLFIQRRRVWVRAVRGEDGTTVVEMAGLGRSESAKLPEELGLLADKLHSVAPSAPEPAETTVEGAGKK
ncbi:cytochrome c biogenesis protein ResB [Streptomyces sp. NBC_01465]|uniref:cytochrome c biogenesis protein ResB n=1 Tax=Streptomyces sp. NBC_01465 TaxID=2903878 RepID=UPI002E2FBEA1|nr:cytochrome c biogenesis protein ResB [Streptomyces sp. NBC_01465]